MNLEGSFNLERFNELVEGSGYAYSSEQETQEDNKPIIGNVPPLQFASLDLEVEVAGPNKWQHRACEGSDQAHEEGEVRDEDGHQNGDKNHDGPQSKSPHFQFTVEGPYTWSHRTGFASEVILLDDFDSRIVRQRVGQKSLHYQY